MRQRLTLLAVLAVLVGLAQPVMAIPAFARRYKVECHFCHDGYPKLNVIGQRFKERGFRMEREDDFDFEAWMRSAPLVLRAQANHAIVEDGEDSNYGFFKLISAGNLGKRFSYWVDDGFFLAEEGDDKFQHVKPDNLWGRLDLLSGNRLYVKAGRMELDLPFTQARTPQLLRYEIYAANTGFEFDDLGSYDEGVEVGGDLPGSVHWSAAVTKGFEYDGSGIDAAEDFEPNVFLRLSKRVRRARVGTFSYIGKNTLIAPPGLPASVPRTFEDKLFRLGGDAWLWIDKLNLYGLYMYGRNSNSTGTDEAQSFHGGFAQADYHAHEHLVLTLRLDTVSRPESTALAERQTSTNLVPGARLYLFERGRLTFEYAFRNRGRAGIGAVQAEVAF